MGVAFGVGSSSSAGLCVAVHSPDSGVSPPQWIGGGDLTCCFGRLDRDPAKKKRGRYDIYRPPFLGRLPLQASRAPGGGVTANSSQGTDAGAETVRPRT